MRGVLPAVLRDALVLGERRVRPTSCHELLQRGTPAFILG